MSQVELDRIDKGVLHFLQQDARNATTTEMGERIGVAASTIRNRIERLEQEGVIRGYQPEIDYGAVGLSLHMVFNCSLRDGGPSEGDVDSVFEDVLSVQGVIAVRELLSDSENIHVEAVGTDVDDLTRIADDLRSRGLTIDRSDVLKRHDHRPYRCFAETTFSP